MVTESFSVGIHAPNCMVYENSSVVASLGPMITLVHFTSLGKQLSLTWVGSLVSLLIGEFTMYEKYLQ